MNTDCTELYGDSYVLPLCHRFQVANGPNHHKVNCQTSWQLQYRNIYRSTPNALQWNLNTDKIPPRSFLVCAWKGPILCCRTIFLEFDLDYMQVYAQGGFSGLRLSISSWPFVRKTGQNRISFPRTVQEEATEFIRPSSS